MIWFSTIDNAAGAAKYFTPEGRDYHVEDERTYAFFGGKGAKMLGLGAFDLDQFKRMLHGLHPTENHKLTAGPRKETNRNGYEVIFDGPKDLSVLWAFGDRRIPGVMEQAMRETLAVIEEDAKARVRVGKADHDRVTGNMTYAAVLHTTAREENGKTDCHLHYHVLLPNATWDSVENKWKALQLQAWDQNGSKLDRPRYIEVYHAQLRHHLHRLGYETETTKDAFRVVGVTDEVRDEFSQRTAKVKQKQAEIEAAVRAERENPGYTLSAKQTAKLAAIYREPKKPGRTMESLVDHWGSRVTPDQLSQLSDLIASADTPLAVEDRSQEAVTLALEHCTHRESRPDQRRVVLEALKFGRGNVTYSDVMNELGRPGVHRREFGGHTELTTSAVANEERSIVAYAVKGRGKWKPLRSGWTPDPAATDGQAFDRLARQTGLSLRLVQQYAGLFEVDQPTAGQLMAVNHALTSPDKVIVWIGKAGAGKSESLKAVRNLGVPMQVVAPTVGASRGGDLKKDFPDINTVASFLRSEEMQSRLKDGLLVIDEIGMLGTKDFGAVCHSAGKYGYRILVVGDDMQHLATVRGNVLGLLRDKAGLPAAEINEILRQKGRYLEAAEAASKHRTLKALDILEGEGMVREGKAEVMIDAAADTYMECIENGQTAVIASPTHRQGAKIVEAVRERLKKEGKLGEEKEFLQLVPQYMTPTQLGEAKKNPDPEVVYQRYDAYRPGTITLAVGDSIRLLGGGKGADGKDLDNGWVGTVTAFPNGNIEALSEDGRTKRVIGKTFGKFQHAYYSTSLGVQSKTRDVTIMPLTADAYAGVGARQFYVDLTRGKHAAVVLTDSLPTLRSAIQRREERGHAIELVRRPRHRVRDKLRRHVAFLRELGNTLGHKVREAVRTRDRENVLDR